MLLHLLVGPVAPVLQKPEKRFVVAVVAEKVGLRERGTAGMITARVANWSWAKHGADDLSEGTDAEEQL